MAVSLQEATSAQSRHEAAALRRSSRYYSLDFWRGVACLCVVIMHSMHYVATPELDERVKSGTVTTLELIAWSTSRLWIGVPMFFVISGYCITAAAESARQNGLTTATYFARRFRRIYPPYWICLACVVPLVLIANWISPGITTDENPLPLPTGLTAGQWLGTLTLTESWRPLFTGGTSLYAMGTAWTLCYEEQFYILMGMALLFARTRFFQFAALLTFATALAVVTKFSQVATGTFLDGHWFDFAAGILVYWCVNRGTRRHTLLAAGALLVGMAAQCINLSNLAEFHPTGRQERLVAFAFALTILLVHPYDRRMAAHPFARLIAKCGIRCYSIYLVHWPICKILSHALYLAGIQSTAATLAITLPLCMASVLAAGWLFHHLVEQRFLNAPVIAPGGRTTPATPPLTHLASVPADKALLPT